MARRRRRTSYPHKLNLQTQNLICECIRSGIVQKRKFCEFAGITTDTFDKWMTWADDETSDNHIAAKRMKHAVELAKLRLELTLLDRMRTVGDDDWRMHKYLLTVIDRDHYSEQAAVKLSGEVKTSDALTDDQRIEALARIFDAARARAGIDTIDADQPVAIDGESGPDSTAR